MEKLEQVREYCNGTCPGIKIANLQMRFIRDVKYMLLTSFSPLDSFSLDLMRLKSKLQPYIR